MANGILDIQTASRLRRFYFRSPSRVSGRKAGIHKSLYKGISPDFLEYKEYNRGDELRQVDWRLYGRHDRLYVKKFEDEVNLNWCILVDSSASMDYGDEGTGKQHYAKTLAATLAYLLLKQGDAVGAGAFSADEFSAIPPKAGNSYITPILDKLYSITPSGGTALTEPMLKALEIFKGDAAFVIISDLFTEETEMEKALQLLKTAGKDTVIFHVLHPDEFQFEFRGSFEFTDMESDEKIIVDTDAVRNTYRKSIGKFMEKLRLLCHEYESRYVFSPTSRPVGEPLLEIADK
jgi:uncharacterized protein (DUF58 family)